jgi:hypothetical protein
MRIWLFHPLNAKFNAMSGFILPVVVIDCGVRGSAV